MRYELWEDYRRVHLHLNLNKNLFLQKGFLSLFLFNLGIAVAKNKRSNEEGLPKPKRESHMVEDDDSGEETVAKRRKLTVNKTLECMMPELDNER